MDQRHIGYAVQSLNRCIGQALNNIPAMRENENLTGIQVWILNFLFRRGERETFQRDVEAEFHVRRSTATELLKQMERGGLIRRVPVGYDARLKKIELTDYAGEVKKQLEEQIRRTDGLLTEGFTEAELDQFFRFVARFETNLAKLSYGHAARGAAGERSSIGTVKI